MRILFFTKGDNSVASSRQRVWRVAEHLKKQYDWEYEVVHSIGYSLFSLLPSRFKILWDIFCKLRYVSYDLLFIHKSLFPWDVVLLITLAKRLYGKKLIYDLDDAEWLHSPRKSSLLAKYADIVFCGSHEILIWARAHNSHCVWVPTVVDTDVYRAYTVGHEGSQQVTIGWVGQGKGHFKAGNFAILQRAFDKLAEYGTRFRFVIIGSQTYQPLKDSFSKSSYETIFVDEAEWTKEDTVPKLLQHYQINVGVMPLQDSAFNRAKCAFKAIEYMACGVPVVASPVGEANHVIKNGINGFLAKTPEEWASAIEMLLRDVSLRERLGKAGQELVRVQYSYRYIIPLIKEELVKLDNKTNNGNVRE